MNDHDFMRYSRQLLLEDIAIEGQFFFQAEDGIRDESW